MNIWLFFLRHILIAKWAFPVLHGVALHCAWKVIDINLSVSNSTLLRRLTKGYKPSFWWESFLTFSLSLYFSFCNFAVSARSSEKNRISKKDQKVLIGDTSTKSNLKIPTSKYDFLKKSSARQLYQRVLVVYNLPRKWSHSFLDNLFTTIVRMRKVSIN